MIRTRMIGQWGNQLFLYTISKIIAERTGQKYRAPRCFVDKAGRPVKWSDDPVFTMESSGGFVGEGARQKISVMHSFDLDSIDSNRPVDIRHGYFQDYSLYQPWKDKIRNEWLKIPEHCYVETDPEAVYIHVRRTDYIPTNKVPLNPATAGVVHTIEQYAACMRRFPEAKNVVVVTDNYGDPFIQELRQLVPAGGTFDLAGGNWDTDFLTLASARWMMISCSTYSWWAGFLGRCERIACPVWPGTFWWRGWCEGNPDCPNLFVYDEPGRWHFVEGGSV